jgi:hypothetical protein
VIGEGSKAPKVDVSLQARTPAKSVFLYATMTMTMSRIGLDYGCEPAMNMENQNNRMHRTISWAQRCVSLVLLSATILPAPSFSQGTLAQRMACTPDVLRLCKEFIPNADEITMCLREKNTELSDACRIVFEAGMQQPPDVSDGTVTRNRTAR